MREVCIDNSINQSFFLHPGGGKGRQLTPLVNAPALQVADLKSPPKKVQEAELVKFSGPVDSVYLEAPEYVELDVGTGKNRRPIIHLVCFLPDVVGKSARYDCREVSLDEGIIITIAKPSKSDCGDVISPINCFCAGAAVAITTTGWEDVVVWSPWDVMPDCYESFCCVESARVSSPVTVPAGESWGSSTEFKVIDL